METNLISQIEILSILAGLLGIITLIVFFVISVNIGNIRKNLQSIQRILSNWSEVNGFDVKNICKNCDKVFYGHPEKCPHCGDPKTYK